MAARTPAVLAVNGRQVDILLACSAGGHLLQLLALRDAWDVHERVWVTDDRSDARSLLDGETVVYAHWPTSRNLRTLARNLWLAWRVVRRTRPRVVLTTGAATAVPFAWVGRLHGARVIWVESVTRVESPSLSCRLVAPIADSVFVQWPELVSSVRGACYAGTVLDS
jgi:UDP-N-acetylglucosamine:LPS N-acetylglucosamine transferase